MKKIVATLLVDEDVLIENYKEYYGIYNFQDALNSELGVMAENGVSLLDWKVIDEEVHMIKDLYAFEKVMKEKYPHLVEIRDEECIDFDDGKKERYTAWLKFPYYSTDSNGGFFSFYTEEEFEQYMTSSIRMFTEEEIKEQRFEIEQYSEFYNEQHKPVFDLDKALNLLHKAKFGDMKVVGYGINISNKNTSFERVATFNDENVAKAFYHSLLASEEVKGGLKIEIEKIYEGKDGYEYEVILSNYQI